jgi:hypothetical protein
MSSRARVFGDALEKEVSGGKEDVLVCVCESVYVISVERV